jgi:citrate lyase subunit beta/citryl-CoA lyase
MSGVSIIHPSQIDAANEAFTPTREEMAYAAEVLQAFEAARARGDGAIALRGQLLDFPIVDRARQTAALGKSLGVPGA